MTRDGHSGLESAGDLSTVSDALLRACHQFIAVKIASKPLAGPFIWKRYGREIVLRFAEHIPARRLGLDGSRSSRALGHSVGALQCSSISEHPQREGGGGSCFFPRIFEFPNTFSAF